jgi:HNH endonuclease
MRVLLKNLSASLRTFSPGLDNHFVCPTCLRTFGLTDPEGVTEAHLIPKAAGGKLATFLCKRCNSQFGARQDKWFGEYVRLKDAGKPIFSTKYKEMYFWIDDLKVNGRWEFDGKDFSYLIASNRNSPEKQRLAIEKAKTAKRVSIPIPLLANRRLVDIGFLTIAYLTWFTAFGYSWVFQKHLDPVREQILHPDRRIIKKPVIYLKDRFPGAWIAVFCVGSESFPGLVLHDVVALLPSFDNPEALHHLPEDLESADGWHSPSLGWPINTFPRNPLLVTFEERIIVSPDNAFFRAEPPLIVHVSKDLPQPELLHPISDEEYKEISKIPGVRKLKHSFEVRT